ncbi:MAG: hypothetical protein FWE35_11395 [Streptosporangiales bacterium]|nr:hypothetical protein [Streptosporangiales bacterium]
MADDTFDGGEGPAYDDDDIEFIDDLDDSYGLDDLDLIGLDFEDVADAIGLPDELPALRLPPETDLAKAARGTALPGTLARLAAWVGTGGRAVTDEGDLAGSDAAEAAREIGVEGGELPFMWEFALTSDWIRFDEEDEDDEAGPVLFDPERVVSGETADLWSSSDDEDVLEAWRATFASVLSGTFDVLGDSVAEDAEEAELDGQGIAMAIMLFLARGEGLALTDISEVMLDTATSEMEEDEAEAARQALTGGYGDPARLVTGMLASLGAVSPPEADDGAVRLTPLGLWAVREELEEIGVEVPLLPASVSEMDAGQLLLVADDAGPDEFEAEADAWVAQREPGQAARELLRVAADEGPDSRLLAVSVVTRIGAGAEPVWRENLPVPALRAYAKIALTGLAADPDRAVPAELEPLPEDLAWVATDMLVLACDDEDPDPEAVADCLGDSVPAGEETALFEMISRVSHPDAPGVLAHIGQYHPDQRIAKEARTAAHKARSLRNGS